jgi:2-keto-4-pentenoate hydratase/2-oxohepta-3-ene-1,7-dioic acid hydratase in catechol pathway
VRIVRLGPPGRERPGVIDSDGRVFDLAHVTPDIDGAFLAGRGLAATRRNLDDGRLPLLAESLDDWSGRIGAPIARPEAVVCVGQNYAAYAAESGSAPPDNIVIFFKHPNTVVGPYDNIIQPAGADKLDWEVELGIVIGQTASNLNSDEEARTCIAGYVLSHDVSERHWQRSLSGGQWSKGKSAPTFNPLGPWLVPVEDLGPHSLRLRSWVNGEPRQDSTTADMIFGPERLVRDLSHYMTFEPGDLINTGTPQGVAMSGRFPFLKPGDVVEMEIDHLGRQRQHILSLPHPVTL